jgi:TM2 domain-containing membrane protein YozV
VQFFLPGLGQLLQGRLGMAIFMFILAPVVWFATVFMFGWVIHLWSIIDAAKFKPRQE